MTDEIKTISYEEYSKARREMQNELNNLTKEFFPEKGYGYVEVYTDFGFGKPVHSEVNWSAIGSVPAEEAVKFAKLLTKAAELANNFEYNGYKVYYTDED